MSPTVRVREPLALATPWELCAAWPRGLSVTGAAQRELTTSWPLLPPPHTQLSSEESKPVSCSPGKGPDEKTADGLEAV